MENALLGSRALEAGIALAVVYIILSVAGSAFVEVLFQLFRVRARLLGNAITALLHEESSTNNHATKSKRHKLSLFGKSITLLLEDEKSTNNQAVKSTKERFFDTSWIKALTAGSKKSSKLDFISPQTFSKAIGEVIEKDLRDAKKDQDAKEDQDGSKDRSSRLATMFYDKDMKEINFADIEEWFQQAMDTLTKRYQRYVRAALFFVGLVAAIVLDADTIALLKAAFGATEPGLPAVTILAPSEPDLWQRLLEFLQRPLGLLLTAMAVTMGSQYWFDVVGKLLSLRSRMIASGMPGWGRPARRG